MHALTIPVDTDPGVDSATQPATILIPYASVVADPAENQRRTPPDPAVVGELLADMTARLRAGLHPQKQPVEVERHGDRWRLVSGFTRHATIGQLAASKDAKGWAPTLWASEVSPRDGYDRTVINLRENLLRSELPPADLAESCSGLRKSTGRDLAQIARDVGRPLSSIANLVRAFENTTPEMWAAFRKGAITQKQVYALAAQTGDEQRLSFEHLMSDGTAPGGAAPSGGTRTRAAPPPERVAPDLESASPEVATVDIEDAAIGGRVRVLREMLIKTPGVRDAAGAAEDYAAGLQAAVRFCVGGRETDAAAIRDELARRMEAIQAQLALRTARGATKPTAPAAPAGAKQLEIGGPAKPKPDSAARKTAAKGKPAKAAKAAPKAKPAKAEKAATRKGRR